MNNKILLCLSHCLVKKVAWYCQDFTAAAVWRDRFSRIESLGEGCDLIDEAIAQLNLENENI